MGDIVVEVELENAVDRGVFERGLIREPAIRSCQLQALVDTGAVMTMIPEEVVSKLGLRERRTVLVSYADERREERAVAGPLTIRIGNRFMNTDCVVGPPQSEPLIGQVVLEELDLIADCAQQTLTPRPESPDYPLLKMKFGRSFRFSLPYGELGPLQGKSRGSILSTCCRPSKSPSVERSSRIP